MKSYSSLLISSLALFAFLLACAITPLKDYEANSTDETEIIQVMIRTQNAWNNSDEDRFIAEFCPEGEFAFRALGTNRGDVRKVPRNEISSRLESLHTNMGDFDIKNPKITVNGDDAVFSSKNFFERYRWPTEILLNRENQNWCIKDWDFSIVY